MSIYIYSKSQIKWKCVTSKKAQQVTQQANRDPCLQGVMGLGLGLGLGLGWSQITQCTY